MGCGTIGGLLRGCSSYVGANWSTANISWVPIARIVTAQATIPLFCPVLILVTLLVDR